MKSVCLRPDLTAMEREEDKAYRTETDKLNAQSPTDIQGNFRWKVAGPPGRLRRIKERDITKWQQEQEKRKSGMIPKSDNSASGTAMLEKGIITNKVNSAALDTITEDEEEISA